MNPVLVSREKRYVTLSDAKKRILDSDLIVWRGPGIFNRVEYHASKLGWWGDDLFSLDTHWRRGGDIRRFEVDVRRYSGRLDWYRISPNYPDYDRQAALNFMRELCGQPYGWHHLACAAVRQFYPCRCLLTREITDATRADTTFPPFCSEACSGSDRLGGGYDPCPAAADRLTKPGELAASYLYEYAGTVICDSDARSGPSELLDHDYCAWLEEHSASAFPALK